MTSLKPCHIDGIIFCCIAFFGSMAASLSTDDAAKYIGASTLWYEKNISTAIGATCLALKMYRSTTYAKYRDVEDRKLVAKADADAKALADADPLLNPTHVTPPAAKVAPPITKT